MLGHRLMLDFASRFEVVGTVRCACPTTALHPIWRSARFLEQVHAERFDSVAGAIERVRPDVVVNCIGLIKQVPEGANPLRCIELNALFPHRLHGACRDFGARLVHISTDCVFSGRKGQYTEADFSDAEDLYGRAKFLGELQGPGAVTLRTSMVGRELRGITGLFEWFMAQRGKKIQGYANAIFTGFTTQAFADIIALIMEQHPGLEGVWQVSSAPISKYDLLSRLNTAMHLGIEIKRDTAFACDRSLDSTRFRRETRFTPPGWDEMIARLAADQTPYEELRRAHVE